MRILQSGMTDLQITKKKKKTHKIYTYIVFVQLCLTKAIYIVASHGRRCPQLLTSPKSSCLYPITKSVKCRNCEITQYLFMQHVTGWAVRCGHLRYEVIFSSIASIMICSVSIWHYLLFFHFKSFCFIMHVNSIFLIN